MERLAVDEAMVRRLRRLQRFGRVPILRTKLRRDVSRLPLRHLNPGGAGTVSSRRIQHLLDAFDHPVYCEVGVHHGRTLEAIRAHLAVGVDPIPLLDPTSLPSGFELHIGTSDQFFAERGRTLGASVIFVDGLHTFEQSYADVINGLNACAPAGIVVIDDVIPSSAEAADPDVERSIERQARAGITGGDWMGDVFRTVLALARLHPELELRTILGAEKPQTLAWRRDPGSVVQPRPSAELAAIRAIDFEDAFRDGVPREFNLGTEDSVLRDAVASTLR